ncbi:MAG: tRNA (guanosine(46)-N7)-methyltransferase TrmB [Bacteroidetes bacterium]|nr:tRNA (guanosine(46)-N7)-methyltransferase TrmB [Bacteroidota bacterium]
MRKKKLRFEEFASLPNCITQPLELMGHWQQQFDVPQPLWLELGAGKAYFAVELARRHPQWNVLALDTKRERMFMGAQQALEAGIGNLRCVWGDAEVLERMMAPAELSGIWITFPDPYPKDRHARRRLTGPAFWEVYRRVLKPGGQVHFKTDDPVLFEWTLEVLEHRGLPLLHKVTDVYAPEIELPNPDAAIPTAFEARWRAEGRTIYYLAVTFT